MAARLAIGLPGAGLDLLGDGLHAARTFAGAGFVRPHRPDRPLRALAALERWGMTAPGGYAVAAALYPGDPAVIDDRGRLTFAEVHRRTSCLAAALADEGVREGDGVAVMCRNHRGFVEAVVALGKLGADALLLNTAHAGPQLREVLDREGPRAVIYDAEFTGLLGAALERRRGFVAWKDAEDDVDAPTLDELVAAGDPAGVRPPSRTPRTTILTSGTTGTPKGASRGAPSAGAAVSILSAIPLHTRERVLVAAPLFHQWGFAHFLLGLLLSSTLILQRKFDPERTLAAIDRERATCCPMVPIMCRRILELPEEARRRYDVRSLRSVPLSGSALPGDLALRFMDEFGDVLYNLYGSTEVAWATIATPRDLREAPGTAGRPPRGTQLRILGEDDRPLPPGETGRIFVGNSMLFEGYTGGGSKTMVDGLMSTGDLGHVDEHGRLFVSGRDDDMIVSGGENVFPQEVEETLTAHEAVREAAVIGVDDEEFGQRLKAFVVTGVDVSEDALKRHVKEHLARFKVPREIVFVDELPRSPQGKVLKRELERLG